MHLVDFQLFCFVMKFYGPAKGSTLEGKTLSPEGRFINFESVTTLENASFPLKPRERKGDHWSRKIYLSWYMSTFSKGSTLNRKTLLRVVRFWSLFLLPLKCQENLHLKISSVYVVCWIFLQTFQSYFCIQANSVDPDQTAPKGAVWSGSTLFAEMTYANSVDPDQKQMTKQMTIVVIGTLRVKSSLPREVNVLW